MRRTACDNCGATTEEHYAVKVDHVDGAGHVRRLVRAELCGTCFLQPSVTTALIARAG